MAEDKPRMPREEPIDEVDKIIERINDCNLSTLTDRRWLLFQVIDLAQRVKVAESEVFVTKLECANLEEALEDQEQLTEAYREENLRMHSMLQQVREAVNKPYRSNDE